MRSIARTVYLVVAVAFVVGLVAQVFWRVSVSLTARPRS